MLKSEHYANTRSITWLLMTTAPSLVLIINDIHVISTTSLRWSHNGHDGVSNHQPYDCLFNRLFRRRSKKTSKLRVTGLCVGNSPGTGEFPAQMASNAEWRHLMTSSWLQYESFVRKANGHHVHPLCWEDPEDPFMFLIITSARQGLMLLSINGNTINCNT